MLLKNGSKGDDVKKLQEKLKLTTDGSFGLRTEEAVKAWQKTNGLKDDGVVGDTTWSKLFGVSAPVAAVVKEDVVIPSGGPLNLEKLKGHIPDSVIAQIPETAKKFNITNNLRLAHFLSQCGHESGGFKAVSENLNYSADGLKKIFGKYFPGNLNESYARQPEKIAARVYASRMGNGNEASGEGWKHRGRGYIQLTGKDNYTFFAASIEVPVEEASEYLQTFEGAVQSACWFWETNNLNQYADSNDILTMTKRINGGTIGLDDRIKHYNHALHVFGGH